MNIWSIGNNFCQKLSHIPSYISKKNCKDFTMNFSTFQENYEKCQLSSLKVILPPFTLSFTISVFFRFCFIFSFFHCTYFSFCSFHTCLYTLCHFSSHQRKKLLSSIWGGGEKESGLKKKKMSDKRKSSLRLLFEYFLWTFLIDCIANWNLNSCRVATWGRFFNVLKGERDFGRDF